MKHFGKKIIKSFERVSDILDDRNFLDEYNHFVGSFKFVLKEIYIHIF